MCCHLPAGTGDAACVAVEAPSVARRQSYPPASVGRNRHCMSHGSVYAHTKCGDQNHASYKMVNARIKLNGHPLARGEYEHQGISNLFYV